MTDQRYSVYILRCADGTLYTGIATDIDRRIQEHERGARGAKYLRGRGPLELVYQQAATGRGLALRIEHRIKQLDRTQKEALIAGDGVLLTFVNNSTDDQASGGAGA